jgi:hypothetical protein
MTKVVTVQAQQKWDYCFESRRTETSLMAVLNELGQQGWELVNAIYFKDMKGIMAWGGFLKRPSVGQTPASPPAQHVSAAAQSTPAGVSESKAGSLNGFDLSGNEFQLKTE